MWEGMFLALSIINVNNAAKYVTDSLMDKVINYFCCFLIGIQILIGLPEKNTF